MPKSENKLYSPDGLVLMTGGLDSVVGLTWTRNDGHNVQGAILFSYVQSKDKAAAKLSMTLRSISTSHAASALS
jgi:7-cyano-7-deazaguanine synthase in queuosine biosynthesis